MAVKNSTFVNNSEPSCGDTYLNSVREEINNAIKSTGEALSDSNLNQLSSALATYSAGSDFFIDSGTANSYSLSPVGAKSTPTAYFAGMRVRFFANATSTGASTINVNSLGVIDIKLANGTDDVAAGSIPINQEMQLTYDGTVFRITAGSPISAATIAPGIMVGSGGTSAPSGWLMCYGQAISRTTYANLFTAIGTFWGVGDGSTTFNIPDSRGRVFVGLDNMGGTSANRITSAFADSLNNTGFGNETGQGANGNVGDTTLTIDQIPAHDHGIPLGTNPSGSGIAEDASTEGVSQTTNSTGGGLPHTHTGSAWTGVTGANVQPAIATTMIIKV